MDGMVTHIATRECLITQAHPATECGVVAARRRCQEQADSAMRRQHEDEQRHGVKEKQDTQRGTLKGQ
jgi:hypothetical protein